MTKTNVDRRVFLGWVPIMIGLTLVGLGGCGKKAPPVPPKRPPLPQVTALKGRLEGDTVYLNWRSEPVDRGVRGYVVLRAQSSAASPPCPGCPLVFQKAGVVSSEHADGAFEFAEPVPEGFIYTYKVQPVGSSGDRGQDSNSVIVDRSGK